MIRDLLSRLCAGLCTPKWLNLPLLIAMLMPLCTHAAALPDGDPDYEFSVDNVTYKCYFEKQNGSNKYYTVYALPENTSITHASIRLGWYRDLKNYISADESGCTPISMNTRLADGVWEDCASLKWVELVVNYWDYNDKDEKNRTINLSPINNCQSMEYIFVTRGNWCNAFGAMSVFYYTENYNPKYKTYYGNLKLQLYQYKYDNRGNKYAEKIETQIIDGFIKSLLKEKSFDMNMDVCGETGMIPEVEVKSTHLSNDAKYYTLSYDNDGKCTVPLIGDFKYNIYINELVDKHSYTGYLSVGGDIFDNCFNIIIFDFFITFKNNNIYLICFRINFI